MSHYEISVFDALNAANVAQRDRGRKEGSFALRSHWLLAPINHEWDAPDTLSWASLIRLYYHRQSLA